MVLIHREQIVLVLVHREQIVLVLVYREQIVLVLVHREQIVLVLVYHTQIVLVLLHCEWIVLFLVTVNRQFWFQFTVNRYFWFQFTVNRQFWFQLTVLHCLLPVFILLYLKECPFDLFNTHFLHFNPNPFLHFILPTLPLTPQLPPPFPKLNLSQSLFKYFPLSTLTLYHNPLPTQTTRLCKPFFPYHTSLPSILSKPHFFNIYFTITTLLYNPLLLPLLHFFIINFT